MRSVFSIADLSANGRGASVQPLKLPAGEGGAESCEAFFLIGI